jgi:DNA-binding response OmpR family regulator
MSDQERSQRGRIIVLIVDGDEGLFARTRLALLREGIDVVTSTSSAQAMASFGGRPFDLVVLDVGPPEVTEWELLRGIRSSNDVAVMLLTGRHADAPEPPDVEQRVEADLEPFGFVAFQARVRSLLRRAGRPQGLDGRLA